MLSPPASPAAPLTTTNLAQFQENTAPVSQHPIVPRAKVTAAAAPRRKQALPGAERVTRPLGNAASSISNRPYSTQPRVSPSAVINYGSAGPAVDPFAAPPVTSTSYDTIQKTPSHKDTVVVCVRVKPTAEPAKDAWVIDPKVAKVALTQGDRAGSSYNYGEVI